MKAEALVMDEDGSVAMPPEIVEVRCCDAKHHKQRVLATWLLHWVTGPVDYCDNCCGAMLRVAEAMGTHAHREPIAQPALVRRRPTARAIKLDGELI